MHAVVETPDYLSDAKTLGLTEAERDFLVSWIASNPEAGDNRRDGRRQEDPLCRKGQREERRLPRDNNL